MCVFCSCTHRSLDELDAGLQVQAEVDEVPLDALPLVLLLLQDEHGVVEELLQTLVGVVDAELLERVVLGTTGWRFPDDRNTIKETLKDFRTKVEFTSKISKPAISRMPRKEDDCLLLLSSVLLTLARIQRNRRSYMALARASTAKSA